MSNVVEIQSGDNSKTSKTEENDRKDNYELTSRLFNKIHYLNRIPSSVNNHGHLSQVTEILDQEEVVVSKTQTDNKDNKAILPAKNLSMIINKIVDLISNGLNKGD